MSIKLYYNSTETQNINFTLSESMPSSEKYSTRLTYKFVFTHEQSDVSYTNLLTDKSIIPFRVNSFDVTTVPEYRYDPSYNIPFEYGGWYRYEVYRLETVNEIVFPSVFPSNYSVPKTSYWISEFEVGDNVKIILSSDYSVYMNGYITGITDSVVETVFTSGHGTPLYDYIDEWFFYKTDKENIDDALEIGKCYVDNGVETKEVYTQTPTIEKYVYKK